VEPQDKAWFKRSQSCENGLGLGNTGAVLDNFNRLYKLPGKHVWHSL
jgi:hypothetical protein